LGFVVAFILISLNLLIRVGIKHINVSASYIDRGEFGLNANTYSYFSFFCNMSLFYLIQLYGKKIYILLSVGCIILGVYISLVTASRSGFLFTSLIAVIYWLFIFDRVKINSLIRFLTIAIIAGYGIFYLSKIYNSSYLKVRVEKASHQGDLREGLVRDAINVFEDHPVLGVGPGQFYNYSYNQSSFSHNSFAEMAANFGFIGIIILLVLFFKPLFLSVKNFYRKNANRKIVKLNILFFTSFILINNIYVFYETTYGMIFFFLIIMIQKKFYYLNFNEKKEINYNFC
jgi:O-antigen ligase